MLYIAFPPLNKSVRIRSTLKGVVMGYGLNKFFSAVTEAIGEEFKEEFVSIQGHTDVSRDTKALILIMIQLLREQKKTNALLAQLVVQGVKETPVSGIGSQMEKKAPTLNTVTMIKSVV